MYGYEDYYNNYYGNTSTSGALSGILAILGTYMIFFAIVGIIMLISMWKIFTKAGEKGWKSLIPIYNIIILLKIVELPVWYIVLFIIPFVNIYAVFKIYIELAHKFGKSTGFGVAMVFFSIICLPILAFGKATYINSSVNTATNNISNNFNNNYQQTQQPNYYSQQPFNGGQYVNNQYQNQNTNVNQNVQGNYSRVQPHVSANNQPMANNINAFNQSNVQSTNLNSNQSIGQTNTIYQNPLPNNAQSNVKYCPNCGNKLEINSTTCFMCGKQV